MAGLRSAGSETEGISARASPIPAMLPRPKATPCPGLPMPPSRDARATSAQNGCSPNSARCSDQVAVSIVGEAAQSRASSAIVAAGMPVMPAAQSGVRVATSARSVSKPTVQRARKSWSIRSSAISTCAIASIIAVSVLGRIGSHSAPISAGMSPRSGETLTIRTPAFAASRSRRPIACVPEPPEAIWPLRSRMPPKQTSSRAFATIARQSTTGPATASRSPRMCGSSVMPAAKE